MIKFPPLSTSPSPLSSGNHWPLSMSMSLCPVRLLLLGLYHTSVSSIFFMECSPSADAVPFINCYFKTYCPVVAPPGTFTGSPSLG